MYCPSCKTEQLLLIDDMAGHVEGRCPKCAGQWLGFNEAASLGLVIDSEASSASFTVANCPRCLEKSLAYTAAPVSISIRPLKCLQCHGIWANEELILKVKNKTVKSSQLEIEKPSVDFALQALLSQNDTDELINEKAFLKNPAIQVWAVPAMACIVWLINSIQLFRFLLNVTAGMWLHELGHAVAFWLTGTFALPLLFFTAQLSNGRSAWMFLISLGVAGFLIWKGLRDRQAFWVALGAFALCLIFLKGVLASETERLAWISYSGVGGEFVLGTLLIITFFYPIFRNPRWRLIRYPLMFAGMSVFIPSWLQWRNIAAGTEDFPLGSLLFGREEGDMNTLLEYGMTEQEVIASYLNVAHVCFVVIAAHVIVAAVRAYRK